MLAPAGLRLPDALSPVLNLEVGLVQELQHGHSGLRQPAAAGTIETAGDVRDSGKDSSDQLLQMLWPPLVACAH
jgi:hypothetical protein